MEGYRFVLPIEVHFADLDGMGHINNAVYLTYMESARIAWWMQVTGRRTLRDVAMILARTEVDYRSPATYGDHLAVGVRCASMRRSSFVLEFRVEERETGRLVAEARKVLVHYDFAAGRSAPLPDALRALILEQDPEAKGG